MAQKTRSSSTRGRSGQGRSSSVVTRAPIPAPIPIHAFLDDPRTRLATIPILLWVCAAVVAHLAGGGGAVEAAAIVHDRDELRAAVRAERASMRPSDTTFELSLGDDVIPTPQPTEPPKDDPASDPKPDDKADPDPDAVKTSVPKPKPPEAPKPKDAPKPEPPKPEAPKPEPPKPPPPPLRPVEPKPSAPAPPAPPPPPPPPIVEDHRQAVQQHVKPNQEDNKSATRIADDANTVDKETMARARAQDQDAPKPSMGASKGGPRDEVGNSADEHSGSAEDHKGDKDHAPGEAKKAATDAQHEAPKPPSPPKAGEPPTAPGGGKGGKVASAPAAPPASPGGAGPSSPEVVSADRGTNSLDPANPGGDGRSKRAGRRRAPSPFETPIHVDSMGRGGSGFPGGPKMNLDQAGVVAAVGNEQLMRERAADGEARKAAHRGRWEKNGFDKWRPAIENYEPSVKLDNVTALNAARSPFATYLVTIHNRIHPIFAEQYLEFLNSRPKTDNINDMKIYTSLEIVLEKATGRIVRMGVTKTSGITEYDLTALSAVDRAGPFGKAPDIIASPDGNVYLHWEFHRDPFDACTTRNARPFLLKEAPKKPATPVGPLRKPIGGPADDRSLPSGPMAPGR